MAFDEFLVSRPRNRCLSHPISNLASNIQRFASLRRTLHMESLRLNLDSSSLVTSGPDDEDYFRCGGRLLDMQNQLRQSLVSADGSAATQPCSITTYSPSLSDFTVTSPSLGPSPPDAAHESSVTSFKSFMDHLESPPPQQPLMTLSPSFDESPSCSYFGASSSGYQEPVASSEASQATSVESWPASHPMYFSPKQTVNINAF